MVRERKVGCSVLKRLLKMRAILDLAMLDQVALPFDVRKQKFNIVRPRGAAATIDGWDHLRVPEDFRVDTHFELWELFERFQFPAKMISKSRHTFTGEEVFLFGMYRLCNVTKLSNEIIAQRFVYVHSSQAVDFPPPPSEDDAVVVGSTNSWLFAARNALSSPSWLLGIGLGLRMRKSSTREGCNRHKVWSVGEGQRRCLAHPELD